MALIKCPDCGKMFSEFAECCPQCGCPVENTNAESDSNQMNFDAEKIEDNASLNNDSILSEDCIKTESDECISTVDETKAEQETNTSQRSSSSGSERLDQSQYSKEEKVIEPIINQSEKKAKKKIKYLLIGVLLGLGIPILSYVIYTQYTSSVEKQILQRAEDVFEDITPELAKAIAQYGIDVEGAEFHNGLLKVKSIDGWGYIDKTGREVIPYKYRDAGAFSNGFAYVSGQQWCGFIDTLGILIVQGESYSDESIYSDGMFFFADNQTETHYVSRDGATLTLSLKSLFSARPFSEGLAAIQKVEGTGSAGKWGFIDKKGKVVIPFQYDEALSFSEGLAAVATIRGQWEYINKKGEIVIPIKYNRFFDVHWDYWAESFSEGLVPVPTQDGQCEYCNTKGEVIISLKDAWGDSFHEGMAKVHKECGEDYLYGFINKKGEEVIPCQYKEAGDFHEGLARVQQDGKWGYVNMAGECVIPCQYDAANNFSEGLAVVLASDGRWGLVDKQGHSTLEFDVHSSMDTEEATLVERARYLVEHLPDLQGSESIDRSNFSQAFYTALKESIEIFEKWEAEGWGEEGEYYAGETPFYWYGGDESTEKDGIVGIFIKERSNTKAVAIASLRVYNSIKLYRMDIIKEHGSWVLDDWDSCKQGMREETKELKKSYQQYKEEQKSKIPDHFESFEDVAAYLKINDFISSDGDVLKFKEQDCFMISGERYPYVFEGLNNNMVASFVVLDTRFQTKYRLHVNLREKIVSVLGIAFHESHK